MDTTQGWRPLGEVIVELGLISQEDLEDALLEQRITHKRLGTILIDKGIVTAQQLTDALVDQIGVDELLEELDRPGNGSDHHEEDDEDAERSPRSLGAPFRRVRDRIHIERPTSRLGKPFSRIGTKATTALGHRRNDAPVAPFSPMPVQADDEPEESFEAAVFELFDHHAPATERHEEPEAEAEAEAEPEQAPEGPHGWLAVARQALDDAEQDVDRLEKFGIARAVELEQARSQLAEHRDAARSAAEGQARAEEEIARLHALIDERDTGLTAMEGTVEELREIVGATQTELDAARGEVERVSAELTTARSKLADLEPKAAELEAASAESERRGARIAELEAKVAELQETLSATDETLGIEMHAREQAQRDSKRLHDELADRDVRVAKLTQQVESLESELEVVVAEREQSQRKLRSRERRLEKLESTLAELRASQAATPETVGAPKAEPSEPAGAEQPLVATIDARPQPGTEAEAEQQPKPEQGTVQTEGFLYFVPRAGDGYELVEQPGSAPAVGDSVDLDGKCFAVTRHSRSPLPFDRRVCVYLRVS